MSPQGATGSSTAVTFRTKTTAVVVMSFGQAVADYSGFNGEGKQLIAYPFSLN